MSAPGGSGRHPRRPARGARPRPPARRDPPRRAPGRPDDLARAHRRALEADAKELYVMRIALEAVAIRITVPTLSSTDSAELEGFMGPRTTIATVAPGAEDALTVAAAG